eukprot:scaffold30588_cov129-Isochrysis_galbana.AAC.5
MVLRRDRTRPLAAMTPDNAWHCRPLPPVTPPASPRCRHCPPDQAVAPAPMTAIQKAEARAKAAAAEAEKQAAQKKAEKKAKQAAAQKVAAEQSVVQKAAEEEAAKAHVEAKAAEEERSATPGSETLPAGEETTWEDAAIAPADPAVNNAEAKQLDAPKSTPGTEPDAEEDSLGLGAGVRKERDEREHLNLVFIGHVDAGKSTFCGQILYQTEQVHVPAPLPHPVVCPFKACWPGSPAQRFATTPSVIGAARWMRAPSRSTKRRLRRRTETRGSSPSSWCAGLVVLASAEKAEGLWSSGHSRYGG